MIYNEDQLKVINEAYEFYKDPNRQVYEFSGGPGTGKTTVLLGILERLNLNPLKVLSMAYIGQAAINMRLKGLPNAKTIHSSIYETKEVLDEVDEYYNRPKVKFVTVDKDLSAIDAMIIDEGGSVPLRNKADIEKHGKKIIVSGDIDQLPPVMDEPAYLTDPEKITRLRTIIRQKEGSGILYLGQRALAGLPLQYGNYKDCIVVDEDEITDEILKKAGVIICGTNRMRDKLTNKIRHDLLHINNELPVYGEKVVFRKNNWTIECDGINIANGLRGTIVNSPNPVDMRDGNFMVDFQPDKFEQVFYDLPCDYKYLLAPHNERKFLKFDKYQTGEKLEFGYAITCHMAQGSEYNSGIFFEEDMGGDLRNRFMYTGITRFKNGLILVKKKRKYF
jgi:exodeoxyribonuclease-5